MVNNLNNKLILNCLFFMFLLGITPFIGCVNTQSQIGNHDNELITNSSAISLDFSTFFGGIEGDSANDIAVAADGSCFIIGDTFSNDFPTKNAFDSTINGDITCDVFVAKFAANGTLLWSTFIGGSMYEYGKAIAVTDSGYCFITGYTMSSDFPTLNAYNDTFGGYYDVFVAKFAPNGTLIWSTFLGGWYNDWGLGITTADNGSCLVTGETQSNDFTTLNAYNSTFGGNKDVFVAKISWDCTLLWSTLIGGNLEDSGADIAVNSNGDCIITGQTESSNFPMYNAEYDTHNGDIDTFVTKFDSDGSLLMSTF
ncbi:MAG: hypothetical protein ACFFDW_17150, partial [Candidatus Thorarchaeota archaeon]